MFSLISLCSRPRSWILLATPLLVFLFFRPLPRLDTDVRTPQLVDTLKAIVNSHHEPPVHDVYGTFRCPQLPGMEDVLVILKTGVTEALQKIPVQIRTSLQCVSHYVIFSDFEEEIAGVQTYDVLRTIKDEIRQQNPDFEIYNRVQRSGRDGLNVTDFPIAVNGPFGRTNNPGWKLDKWKFLPMVDKALQVRPDAKWYVFMEADTYLIWPNLVAWLARLDSTKPQYLGNPVQISDIIFAHGGSGIVLSNPAMHLVSDHYSSYGEEINNFTTEQWAGDCVLGKVLADVGVTLSWSWPMLQGGMPWNFDYFGDAFHKRTWCYPAISYHHANATELEQMWQFSQEWFQNVRKNSVAMLGVFFSHDTDCFWKRKTVYSCTVTYSVTSSYHRSWPLATIGTTCHFKKGPAKRTGAPLSSPLQNASYVAGMTAVASSTPSNMANVHWQIP